jgi:hypothetical protein
MIRAYGIRVYVQSLANAQALRAVLATQRIPYTEGVGRGVTVFDIDTTPEKYHEALRQWVAALTVLLVLAKSALPPPPDDPCDQGGAFTV